MDGVDTEGGLYNGGTVTWTHLDGHRCEEGEEAERPLHDGRTISLRVYREHVRIPAHRIVLLRMECCVRSLQRGGRMRMDCRTTTLT